MNVASDGSRLSWLLFRYPIGTAGVLQVDSAHANDELKTMIPHLWKLSAARSVVDRVTLVAR